MTEKELTVEKTMIRESDMKDSNRVTTRARMPILLVIAVTLLAFACGNNKSFDSAREHRVPRDY